MASDNPVLIDGEQINGILVIVPIDIQSIRPLQIAPAPLFDEDLMPEAEVFFYLILIKMLVFGGDNMDLCHRMLSPILIYSGVFPHLFRGFRASGSGRIL